MSAEVLKGAANDEFAEISRQIEKLETMMIENSKDIQKFQEANLALKKTIELLKQNRQVILGIAEKVRPLTAADKALVKGRGGEQ